MASLDLDKFDVILDQSDPDFVEKFRAAVGLKPGETLEIHTPQFERTDGLQVALPQVDFAKMHLVSAETLKRIGCCMWDEPDKDGNVLWLYPAEWYDHIPEGTPLVCIDGETSLFKRGETDDDMRFGCLAYGFLRKAEAPHA
jgi:hypothetical protein